MERGSSPSGSGLGRNTVALAFEQLVAEGYLESRTGRERTSPPRPKSRWNNAARDAARNLRRAQNAEALRAYIEMSAGGGPLRPGTPDLAMFPKHAWARCARKALSVYEGDLGYARAAGLRSLQDAIAGHCASFAASACGPNNLVVEGAQAALHLIASVVARAGDPIVLEVPCYALARAAFEAYDLRLRPVPVDDEGLGVDSMPSDVRLAFVTPTHQYPLGGALTIARRNALLQWAVEREAYVIEDDYDSEFTLMTRPLPPLQCLDRDERVLYVGSFSKTLAPAVRVGYVVAPPHLSKAFTVARAVDGLGVGIHLQATLAEFIAQGHFARHIRRANAAYDRRRAILMEALRPALTLGFRLGPALTGLHLAFHAKRGFDDVAMARAVPGQRFVALSPLCIRRRDCHGFLLGFTNGSDNDIAAAAASLMRPLHSKL